MGFQVEKLMLKFFVRNMFKVIELAINQNTSRACEVFLDLKRARYFFLVFFASVRKQRVHTFVETPLTVLFCKLMCTRRLV